jgi:hypothetical protein
LISTNKTKLGSAAAASEPRSYYRKGSAALQPKVLGIDYTKKLHLFKLPYTVNTLYV